MKKEYVKKLKTLLSSGIFSLLFLLLPLPANAAGQHPELNVYQKILQQRQNISCRGTIVSFDIDAFMVTDVNGDGVYELIASDYDLCTSALTAEHTHLILYKYQVGGADITNAILTEKGGEKTVYISKKYARVMAQTFDKAWLALDQYGYPYTYETRPSEDFQKYSLYKNTAKNRKNCLNKIETNTATSNKYEKKLANIAKKQEKLQNTMNKKGKKVLKQVSSAYDSLRKKPLNQLSKNIKTTLASNLPASAEKALIKVFTDTIQENLIVKSSSYKNCKTAAQLVNKVASQLSDKNGSFTFRDQGITYTVTFQSFGTTGASYIRGSVKAGNGRTYTVGGTVTSKAVITDEMNELKKFSDQKVEEAKKAVLSASGDLLAPKAFRKYLKTASKSRLYQTVRKKSPATAKLIKKGIDTADKFSAVEKAYKNLFSADLQNTPEDKIIKQISQYYKKVDAFEKAVDALF